MICCVSIYSQNCIEGDCINGYGSVEYPLGDIYKGSFKNNLMHGQGVYTYSDGTKYTGMFSNNYIHGEGEVRFINGTTYKLSLIHI